MSADNKIFATWNLNLYCDCPNCKEHVDLLDYPDFWDGRSHLKACENNSIHSENVDVICPKCGHEFIVDLEY